MTDTRAEFQKALEAEVLVDWNNGMLSDVEALMKLLDNTAWQGVAGIQPICEIVLRMNERESRATGRIPVQRDEVTRTIEEALLRAYNHSQVVHTKPEPGMLNLRVSTCVGTRDFRVLVRAGR